MHITAAAVDNSLPAGINWMKPVYQAERGIHIGENVALNKNIIHTEFKLNIPR